MVLSFKNTFSSSNVKRGILEEGIKNLSEIVRKRNDLFFDSANNAVPIIDKKT